MCSGPTRRRCGLLHYLLRVAAGAAARGGHRAARGAGRGSSARDLSRPLRRWGGSPRSSWTGSTVRRRRCSPKASPGRRWTRPRRGASTTRPRATRCSSSRRCGPGCAGAAPKVQAVIAARLASSRSRPRTWPAWPRRSGASSTSICWPRRPSGRQSSSRAGRAVAAPDRPRAGPERLRLQPRQDPRGRLSRARPARRRQLHLAVARALQRSDGRGRGADRAALRAGRGDRGGDQLARAAAEAAQRLHAHAEAVRVLERALALSENLPPAPAPPGCSSGCSPRCPPRWWLSRATCLSG